MCTMEKRRVSGGQATTALENLTFIYSKESSKKEEAFHYGDGGLARGEASGVPPRILCIGLTFLPLSVPRPASPSPLFPFTPLDRKRPRLRPPQASKARPLAGVSERERPMGARGREGGREAAWENSEEEGSDKKSQNSSLVNEVNKATSSLSDGGGGGGQNAKPKHYPIYWTATAEGREWRGGRNTPH